MNRRCYILGPMRGVRLYNFPEFDRAEGVIRDLEYFPVSPAQIDREHGFDPINLPKGFDWNTIPEGLNLREIIDRDIAALRDCGSYVCLPGWEKSKGATAEKALLDWQGSIDVTEYVYPVESSSLGNAPACDEAASPSISSTVGKDTYEVGKGKGVKFDQGKPRMSLMPWDVLQSVSDVFTYGAAKYSDDNWSEGMRWRRMADAMLRHFTAWVSGEDIDKESGFHHLAHMNCCAQMLYGMVVRNVGTDDRPTRKTPQTPRE